MFSGCAVSVGRQFVLLGGSAMRFARVMQRIFSRGC
jgi:hypothetical protein